MTKEKKEFHQENTFESCKNRTSNPKINVKAVFLKIIDAVLLTFKKGDELSIFDTFFVTLELFFYMPSIITTEIPPLPRSARFNVNSIHCGSIFLGGFSHFFGFQYKAAEPQILLDEVKKLLSIEI